MSENTFDNDELRDGADNPDGLPDPSGSPQPLSEEDAPKYDLAPKPGTGLSTLVTVAAATGASFLLFGAMSARTCGATRSSQLQWEQRNAEIERAIEEAEADERAEEESQSH